jgi:16S rRNA (adenine1518-N6/adenine1519-N6)-dimethyltransferase
MDVKTVKKLLKKQGVQPSKGLGQNFLINERVFKQIIETASLSKNDAVLEIGPGIGNLTLKLAKIAKKIIAIEKDKRMCDILREMLKYWSVGNVEIINQDILKLNPLNSEGITGSRATGLYPYTLKPYKLIANLPYYITSPVIRKFLEIENKPKEMILMVQKEVAKRICAKPPKMSVLAVSVQFYANPEIISFVSKKSFWPQPKVDSAIIKIVPRKSANIISVDQLLFFKIVKAGFSHPRKQLINNLSRLNFPLENSNGQVKNLKANKEQIKSWLLKNKVQPSQRAETLTVQNWLKLTDHYEHCQYL